MGLSAMLYRKHKYIDTPHFGYASLYCLRHELAPKVGFVYTQYIGNDKPEDKSFMEQMVYTKLNEDDFDTLEDGQKVITNWHKFFPSKDEQICLIDKAYDKYLWEFFIAPDTEGVIDLKHCKYYYGKFKNIELEDNQERLNILLKVLKAGIDNSSSVVYL